MPEPEATMFDFGSRQSCFWLWEGCQVDSLACSGAGTGIVPLGSPSNERSAKSWRLKMTEMCPQLSPGSAEAAAVRVSRGDD